MEIQDPGLERGIEMFGRFSAHRAVIADTPPPVPEPPVDGDVKAPRVQAPPIAPEGAVPAAANPLQTDKLLDAKVRLHRKLIEEINLQALERLPENEMHGHIQKIVSQYVLAERLALNSQELSDFVAEIIDEMTGLGPLEPLLKDPSISDIL